MHTIPSYDPSIGWPYFADESLEPDGSEGLQLDDSFDQLTDNASNFSASNATCSPSCLLPLDHDALSMSSSSGCNSCFDPNPLGTYPAVASWDLSAGPGTADNRRWSYSQQTPPSNLYNFNDGETSQSQSFSQERPLSQDQSTETAYKNWLSNSRRHTLDAGDPLPYASILEELTETDDPMLVDIVVSSASPPDVHSYTLRSTRLSRSQPLRKDSYPSTRRTQVLGGSLPPSPVSSDDRSPAGPKSPISKKGPYLKKSPSKAKMPHSAVEKRYRSNLNSKMIELQQCVPTLHVKTTSGEEVGSPESTTSSPKQDGKFAKGLILEGAADYIRLLEARTSELDTHVELLERRLAVLQKIALEKKKPS